ncbi:MAG: dTDP-4-dehydrorhamnose reductase [Cyanothece sp. SIO1E1]|nr:dTDP-4-dehydrorhamnose reductase [Cyanothece sp. SIO1E1]
MRFLITGATGQLGTEWVRYLKFIKEDFSYFTSSELDITKPELVEKRLIAEQPDVVINCAAYTAVDRAESELEKAEIVNCKGVKYLSEICFRRGIKLVHYSTDYVFSGDKADIQQFPEGYKEEAPCNPVNAYGRSKLRGEQEILRSGVDFLLLRVSWLCGIDGNNFVKTMLKLSGEKKSLNVVNDQLGVPTFCNHVVRDTHDLLKKEVSGIFHIGSRGLISWFDFAQKIFELSRISTPIHPVSSDLFETTAKRPAFSKLDISKVEEVLDRPSISWDKGLSELLENIK